MTTRRAEAPIERAPWQWDAPDEAPVHGGRDDRGRARRRRRSGSVGVGQGQLHRWPVQHGRWQRKTRHQGERGTRHEAGEARTAIAASYRGYTAFVGGDFNDDPLSAVADNFYHPDYRRGARGGFKEVDSPCGKTMAMRHSILYCRSGEKTIGSGKIDYLFVRPSVHVNWADVTNAKHSDHRILWAGVAV